MRTAASIMTLCLLALPSSAAEFESSWSESPDRPWVGADFWANRLQDWAVREGRLEVEPAGDREALRTVHLLTHSLSSRPGAATIRVRLGRLEGGGASAGGLLVGVGPGLDWRSTALVQLSGGPGAGLFVGVDDGGLFVMDLSTARARQGPDLIGRVLGAPAALDDVELEVVLTPGDVGTELSAVATAGGASLRLVVAVPGALEGGVALVSHPGFAARPQNEPARFWFRDLEVAGERVDAHPERALGPILSTKYTVSKGGLHLTAQLFPLGPDDATHAELELGGPEGWTTAAETDVRRDSYTATFHVYGLETERDVPYRVAWNLARRGGEPRRCEFTGIVRSEPIHRETVVVAGFTGNHNIAHGLASGRFDWTQGVWFPHQEIVDRVAWHDPDLLFFSGDQVYEGASPTRPDTENIRLDYLYKWYLWCWAYRDLARSRPCITIPDDHDVYQGNIWGEGGRKTDKDDKGGYVHPADFVRVVEHTQTDSLPPPFDPTPIEQDIGVYYTSITWGGIGFAVVEDRKFKSGCSGRIAGRTRGRADHINDPDFDIRQADVPGLTLLGPRQLEFLDAFARDWSGQEMKVCLSQTIFANMATHHGAELFRLIADLDSNGWPQSGRNRALDALRRGFVFHLAGDQHLASLVRHGIEEHDDAIWSFCVPSIANFYPRAWMPEGEGDDIRGRPNRYMGRHRDGLGNLVNVYATTNPWHPSGKTGTPKTGAEPTVLHDRAPGYGIVRLDKSARTITAECWPRHVDPAEGRPYRGWPRVIEQTENYGRRAVSWLPRLEVTGMEEPVVEVLDEASGEVVYTLRIRGSSFRPKVFGPPGTLYTIRIGEPGTERMRELRRVESRRRPDEWVEVDIPR